MFKVPLLLLRALVSVFRHRADLVLEILALRQQLAAFALSGRRPRITSADRWFWIVLRRRRGGPTSSSSSRPQPSSGGTARASVAIGPGSRVDAKDPVGHRRTGVSAT